MVNILNHATSVELERQYQNIFLNANDGLIINDLETKVIFEANPAVCNMLGYSRRKLIGLPLTKIIHSDSQMKLKEQIDSSQSTGRFYMQARLLRRNGSTFYGEWNGTMLIFHGRPCLLSVVRNIDKRIRAEKLLQQHVETRAHEQAVLLNISHTLASSLEFQPHLILDQLREIIEYAHGAIFKLEDHTLTTLAMRGTPPLDQYSPFHIRLQGTETLTVLFNKHRPIRIADVCSNSRQARFLHSLLDDGAAALLEGVHSWMWVPLAVRGRINGIIGIADARKSYFTTHHANLALRVAHMAAITMANFDLYQQSQVLAVLEERHRLARDLHDAVNQSLFSAGLIAEVLPRLWERDPKEARHSLEDLRRLTRGAQAEMRALLAELRPSTLTDSNLSDLLQLLGNALSGRTNTRVVITVKGEFYFPSEVQIAFYRVCQEALINIERHARASLVEINLRHAGTIIELKIRDNGQGFDPKQNFPGHYGLNVMRERAEAARASFSIASQSGRGTEITLRWKPLKETV